MKVLPGNSHGCIILYGIPPAFVGGVSESGSTLISLETQQSFQNEHMPMLDADNDSNLAYTGRMKTETHSDANKIDLAVLLGRVAAGIRSLVHR